MLIKFYQIRFVIFLILGTLISISANRWFTRWLGLEINLISIIPLILISLNAKVTEASIKYFLTQAIASLLLILTIIFNYEIFETIKIEITDTILISSIIIKAGMSPLHFWFPQVIINLNWEQCIIIITWQKIAPLILLSSANLNIILIFRVASVITGALGGLNQNKIKIILTYSSIAHSGWILTCCKINFNTWVTYFLIYCILSLRLIFFLKILSTENNINEINNWPVTKIIKYTFILNIFSLGGLPPLLGFISKLLVIQIIIYSKINFILIIFILRSLISLYFYSRTIYSSLIIKSNNLNINFYRSSFILNILSSIVIFWNIFIPVIYILN